MTMNFPGLEFQPVPCAYCHTNATVSRTPVVNNGNTRYVHAVLCNHATCPKREYFVGGGLNESVKMWNEHMARVPPTGELARRMYRALKSLEHTGVKMLHIIRTEDGKPNVITDYRMPCCPYCRGQKHAFQLDHNESAVQEQIGHDDDCELHKCISEFEGAHPHAQG